MPFGHLNPPKITSRLFGVETAAMNQHTRQAPGTVWDSVIWLLQCDVSILRCEEAAREEGSKKDKVLRLCRNNNNKKSLDDPYSLLFHLPQSFFCSFCSFGWVGLLLFPDLKLMMQSTNGERITCSVEESFFFALGKWIPWRVQIYSGQKKKFIFLLQVPWHIAYVTSTHHITYLCALHKGA